jgi:hypothetical protein
MRSNSNVIGSPHPQSWVIESSDDGMDWVQIDGYRNTLNFTVFLGSARFRSMWFEKRFWFEFARLGLTGKATITSISTVLSSLAH